MLNLAIRFHFLFVKIQLFLAFASAHCLWLNSGGEPTLSLFPIPAFKVAEEYPFRPGPRVERPEEGVQPICQLTELSAWTAISRIHQPLRRRPLAVSQIVRRGFVLFVGTTSARTCSLYWEIVLTFSVSTACKPMSESRFRKAGSTSSVHSAQNLCIRMVGMTKIKSFAKKII